ncbi:hypothetical protein D3C87_1405830 [compost metagenome]
MLVVFVDGGLLLFDFAVVSFLCFRSCPKERPEILFSRVVFVQIKNAPEFRLLLLSIFPVQMPDGQSAVWAFCSKGFWAQ